MMQHIINCYMVAKCLATVVLDAWCEKFTLESINDLVSSLSYILDVASITFQAINEIVDLTGAIPKGTECFLLNKFLMVPD